MLLLQTTVPVDGHSLPEYKAVTVDVHKDMMARALVPNVHAATHAVRRVLPSHVTHGEPFIMHHIGSAAATKFYIFPGCNQNIPPR